MNDRSKLFINLELTVYLHVIALSNCFIQVNYSALNLLLVKAEILEKFFNFYVINSSVSILC